MDEEVFKYPIGIQSFVNIREDNYVYVDKTAIMHRLVNSGSYFFLARPRRFGKSLLLSTLEAYFKGRKELFDGLEISRLESQWKSHPVLHMSLAPYNPDNEDSLADILNYQFDKWEREFGISNIYTDFSSRLRQIIENAHAVTGEKVVILVDEYDAPLVAHINDEQQYNSLRNLLKSIYVNLKECDSHIRFAMLTGITRFSRMNIFSGLNNLNDISLDSRYSAICGITEQELRDNFKSGISMLGKELNVNSEGALALLKQNYDGYHFTASSPDIYNPFSLLLALDKRNIGAYWFVTGTPSFLVETIRSSGRYLPDLFNISVEETSLLESDTYKSSLIPLLFQTGYLTIKGYDREDNVYSLGLPNREVREGLSRELLASYSDTDKDIVAERLLPIRRAFRNGNPDEAIRLIQSFLASIPYSLTRGKPEIYFENNLYLIFNLIGVPTHAEWQTSCGRIDILLEMPRYVYVIELKLDGSADEAMRQIHDKQYDMPFRADKRQVYLIGVNFSKKTRNISDWIINPVDR